MGATFQEALLEERAGSRDEDRLNEIAERAFREGAAGARARRELQELLGLDDLNFEYFRSLLKRLRAPNSGDKLVLHDPGADQTGKTVAHSAATAPSTLLKHLPVVQHAELVRSGRGYGKAAQSVLLWVKKMQAGTGTSMIRTAYLADELGIEESRVRISAKGLDLFAEVPDRREPARKTKISLAEAQIVQQILDLQRGVVGGVIFHDLVGPETQESVRKIWDKPSYLNPSKSYQELVESTPRLGRSGSTFQAHIPTIDENNKLSFQRVAPGGHAIFGVEGLRAAYRDSERPEAGEKTLIAVISNGEDLSANPDPSIIGWMREERIPIAMVTTDKTEVDFHGGQIALVTRPDNSGYVTIFEQAQAKASDQVDLFEQLGLRPGDHVAFFNTNMALYNYDVLVPKLKELVAEIGEEEFLDIVTPDLIQNRKEQTDVDGAARKYVQLEGAMGSTLLNLDRYWREHFHEPIVHFVNIEKQSRTDFFLPLKSPFDFFMQFYSDHFFFDPSTMRVKNLRPGHLPSNNLKGPHKEESYYKKLKLVLDTFRGTSLIDLDELHLKGRVLLSQAALKHRVRIVNRSSELVDITSRLLKMPDIPKDSQGRPVLDNLSIEINPDGTTAIVSLCDSTLSR